jgi:hypothetical protein
MATPVPTGPSLKRWAAAPLSMQQQGRAPVIVGVLTFLCPQIMQSQMGLGGDVILDMRNHDMCIEYGIRNECHSL